MSFLLKMSLSLKPADFPHICRVCLLRKDKMQPVHVRDVLESVHACTKIEIAADDDLPAQICASCKSKFTKFFKFKKFCENSDKLLRKILNQAHKDAAQPNEIEVPDVSRDDSDSDVIVDDVKETDTVVDNLTSYPCGKCDLTFESIMSLWSHERTHARPKHEKMIDDDVESDPVSCDVCKRVYENKKRLDRHMHTHRERTHECHVCGKRFIGKSKLERHLIVHKPKEEKTPCLFCDKTFAYEVNLRQHHRRYHEGELKRIVCTVCGKDFVDIKTHSKTHTNDPTVKPFKCDRCPKAFRLNSTLTKHVSMKHDENPPSATKLCSTCGKRCFSTGELRSHMLVHTDVRSFACELCDKRFKLKSALNFHFRTHTGDRPHACTVCSKSFYASTTLKRHMVIHTGERPFECNVCEKAFRQRSTLKAHMRIHRTRDVI